MIPTRFLRALLLVAFVPTAHLAAQAPDPFVVLASAGAVYRKAPATCADFEQTLHVPLLGQDVKGRGRLCSKQPNLFSMRFTEPSGDVYLADGRTLWRYTPSTDAKQVLKIELALGPRGIDFYHDFLDAPKGKYQAVLEAKEVLEGRSVHRIALTPIQRTTYKAARVWIDAADFVLRKIEITEENGSVRTVVLRSVSLSPRLASDEFSFAPPPGTSVISR